MTRYGCYMSDAEYPTISHREFRNQSGEVLRRAQAGETMLVTSHGKPVALLGPPGNRSRLRLKPARTRGGFSKMLTKRIDESVMTMLEDLRSER